MDYPVTYKRYQEALREGLFLGVRCQDCHSTVFPPRAICSECGGKTSEEIMLRGYGTIRTFTVIRVPPGSRKAPYVIVMVELDEGPYVIGNLLELEPDRAGMQLIGKRVKMISHHVSGDLLLRGEFVIPGFLIL